MAVNDEQGWEKVETNPTWDYENQTEFVGTYIASESNVGPNNSNLYTFRTADGSLVGVWGNTILDNRLKNCNAGDEVKIAYLGKVASNKVKGREYHNFEVWKRRAPMEKVGDGEVTESKSVAEAEGATEPKEGFIAGLEADQAKEAV